MCQLQMHCISLYSNFKLVIVLEKEYHTKISHSNKNAVLGFVFNLQL